MDYRALIDRVGEVCPLPSSVARVLSLTQDPNARLEPIADAIATDPALAAELLRLVASPAYASRIPVTDLRGAAARVGLRELHDMSAAMAMMVAFRSENELGVEVHNTAVLSGNLAHLMAARLGHDNPRMVFLAGLLADIGVLACLAVDAEAYVALRGACGTSFDLRAVRERDRYGVTSWEIGGALLERNHLPDRISEAVAGRARPGGDARGVAATWFARRVSQTMMHSARRRDHDWVSEVAQIAKSLGIDAPREALEELCVEACRTASDTLRLARAS